MHIYLHRSIKRFCLFALFALISHCVYAHQFIHVGLSEGLSSPTVRTIAQDRMGRMWFGTYTGVYIYDGNRAEHYSPVTPDFHWFADQEVYDIEIYGDDLWVANISGVFRFNLRTQESNFLPINNVNSVFVSGDSTLYIGSISGLYAVPSDEFYIKENIDTLMLDVPIRALEYGNNGTKWVCTDDGLFELIGNKLKKRFQAKATTVHSGINGEIWLGTMNDGVYLLDYYCNEMEHFTETSKVSLPNNIIRDLAIDETGAVWIGTFQGLGVLTNNDGHFEIKNYNTNDNGLSHNSIYDIHAGTNGLMWVGSFFGGVDYYNPRCNDFKVFTEPATDGSAPSHMVISTICEFNDNLLVGTLGGGLNVYDRKTGRFRYYQENATSYGLPQNNVEVVCPANDETILVGTLMGFGVLSVPTRRFENYTQFKTASGEICKFEQVYHIVEYNGEYILGTDIGLLTFNLKNKSLRYFLHEEKRDAWSLRINQLFVDSKNTLWVATNRSGLFYYDDETMDLKHMKALTSDEGMSLSIAKIYEDLSLRLWISTMGDGLYCYDLKNEETKHLTRSNVKLPSDCVFAVTESRYGGLWISTIRGLSYWNEGMTYASNYTLENGFPIHLSRAGSLKITHDGMLCMGGVDGLLFINEESLLKSQEPMNLLFSKLLVNQKPVNLQASNKNLVCDINYADEINLYPSDRMFELNFASCNYNPYVRSIYSYRIRGFQEEWIDLQHTNKISLAGLQPGKYKIDISAFSGVLPVSIYSKTIDMVVHPPFYRTTMAYIFYVVLLILAIYAGIRFYLYKVRVEDRMASDQLEKDRKEALHQQKLRFFTNVSHEFRTPLTLIVGQVSDLIDNTHLSAYHKSKLQSVERNARQLTKLISELLDFRKVDQGFLQLKVSEINLHQFLQEIFANFHEYAVLRKINYEIQFEIPEDSKVWIDPDQLEKVFYNLISNAFKIVAPETGLVRLVAKMDGNKYLIGIEDNGKGIDSEAIERIFERFYQLDMVLEKKSNIGTGIGLALSKDIVESHHGKISVNSQLGVGSNFTIELQSGKEHFDESVICERSDWNVTEYTMDDIHEIDDVEIVPAQEDNLQEKPLLLIVEDNTDLRAFLCGIFSNSFNIIEAENGQIGFDKAMEHLPNLIITDVMMPEMTGTEMCAQLKRNVISSHIPIIIVTAKTALEYKIEGLETGADDYITKPFSVKVLKLKVRNLLQTYYRNQTLIRENPLELSEEVSIGELDKKFLNKVNELISENLSDEDFSFEPFLRELGMGRSKFYEKIKAVTGETPNDLLQNFRLQKSMEYLLAKPDENISEIAYSVGFSTPNYFQRCFKKRYGMTPMQFRKKSND